MPLERDPSASSGHPDGALYKIEVVCADSSCKLEHGRIRAKDPAEAEAELRRRLDAYPTADRIGRLTREDGLKPWLTVKEPANA